MEKISSLRFHTRVEDEFYALGSVPGKGFPGLVFGMRLSLYLSRGIPKFIHFQILLLSHRMRVVLSLNESSSCAQGVLSRPGPQQSSIFHVLHRPGHHIFGILFFELFQSLVSTPMTFLAWPIIIYLLFLEVWPGYNIFISSPFLFRGCLRSCSFLSRILDYQ